MPSRVLLAVAMLLASDTALSKMSECETRCENIYKACATGGKMTERACRVEREKCRKACLKKADSAG